MTTGKAHRRITEIELPYDGSDNERRSFVQCRCTIGEDHNDENVLLSQYDPAEDEEDDMEGEPLSVYAAADIWRSNGEDPDYSFGYDEDELSRAAEEE